MNLPNDIIEELAIADYTSWATIGLSSGPSWSRLETRLQQKYRDGAQSVIDKLEELMNVWPSKRSSRKSY